MDARGLTNALKGDWCGNYGTARCPAHDDRKPSLSISDGDEGTILVHCHAGCTQPEVIDALAAKQLWNGQAKSHEPCLKPVTHKRFGAPDEVYAYNEDFEVWRWQNPDGKGKEIRPLARIDGDWMFKAPPAPRPLYHIEDLRNDTFRPVLLVEGEKTTEAARLIVDDHSVVTWPGGAKAINHIDWSALARRKVIGWPDADDEGKKAMREIAARLTKFGADFRIVDVPSSLPRKWDLANEIPDDMDIQALIAEAPQHRADRLALPSQLTVILPETLRGEPPERPWLIGDWVPLRSVTMLSGDGGLGKSLLAMQLQTCCAIGRPWLGQFALQCVSVGVYCEDEVEELHRRQYAINKGLDIETPRGMHWISRVGQDNALATFDRFTGEMETTGLYEDIHQLTQDVGAKLLILDALHDMYPGNENDRVTARRFINLLAQLACDMDGAVLLNSHPSLSGRASGTGESGSTAWGNAVRSRLYFSRPQDEEEHGGDRDARLLSNRKSNYAASGSMIECSYKDGIFAPKLRPLAGNATAQDVFLRAAEHLYDKGVNMSFSPHAQNFAPRTIEEAQLNEGKTRKELARAMRDLDRRGAIGIEEYGPPSSRSRRLVVLSQELFGT